MTRTEAEKLNLNVKTFNKIIDSAIASLRLLKIPEKPSCGVCGIESHNLFGSNCWECLIWAGDMMVRKSVRSHSETLVQEDIWDTFLKVKEPRYRMGVGPWPAEDGPNTYYP